MGNPSQRGLCYHGNHGRTAHQWPSSPAKHCKCCNSFYTCRSAVFIVICYCMATTDVYFTFCWLWFIMIIHIYSLFKELRISTFLLFCLCCFLGIIRNSHWRKWVRKWLVTFPISYTFECRTHIYTEFCHPAHKLMAQQKDSRLRCVTDTHIVSRAVGWLLELKHSDIYCMRSLTAVSQWCWSVCV